MSKRVKRNTYLTYGHKFDGVTPDYSSMSFGKALSSGMGKVNLGTLGGSIGGALKGSGAGAIGSAVGGAIGGMIGGGYQSGAGDVFNKIGDIGSAIPGPWGAIIGGGAKVLGGVVNAAFGSKVDQEKLNAANEGTATLNSFKSNASSFDDVKGVQAVANVQDAYKGGWFAKSDARKKNEELRRQRAAAMSFADRSVENNIENIADEQMNNMLANYAAFGGPLHTNGTDFSNGVQLVGAGGSHESNPLEGVPMGIAPDGQPNLVEEGEVIFNDYVFSKRLKVPKAVREKYKIRGTKDLTFADAAKKAQKESEERPNDPISKRGLEAAMKGLMYEQEQVRQKREERKAKQAMFAYGGNLYACGGHKYELGDFLLRNYDNPIYFPSTNVETDGLFGNNYLSDVSVGLEPIRQIARAKTLQRGDGSKVRATDNNTNLTLIPTGKPDTVPMLDLEHTQGVPVYKETPITLNEKLTLPNIPLNPNTYSEESKKGWKWDESYLRYVPAIGAGLNVLSDLFGLTNKPDYSDAEAIKAAAGSLRDVGFTPIGDYMKYTPFDRLFYANQLGAQAGATRRNIMNTSGGNRGVAMAGLLGADYNTGNQLGNLYRQAEEYNLGQRHKVAEFNRGTNQFNAENDLKAQIANIDNNSNKVRAAIAAAELKDKINARTSAARSANLTNLFDSIGDIGREAYSRNMILSNPALYYSVDRTGRVHYKNGYENLSDAEKAEVQSHARYSIYSQLQPSRGISLVPPIQEPTYGPITIKSGKKEKNGGYITIKSRRRNK